MGERKNKKEFPVSSFKDLRMDDPRGLFALLPLLHRGQGLLRDDPRVPQQLQHRAEPPEERQMRD